MAERAARRRNSPPRANTQNQGVLRHADGRWQPGASPNPSGRPRVAKDVQDLARQHSETALKTLIEVAEGGKPDAARVAAAVALWDRGFGKPTQPIAGDDQMAPIGVAMMTDAERRAEIERRQRAAAALLSEIFGTEDPDAEN